MESNRCDGGADVGGGLVYLRRAGSFVRGNEDIEDIIANSDMDKPHAYLIVYDTKLIAGTKTPI